jgi:hypothetical protein
MRRGALLHDIGKIGVPDQILLKPGPLTDAEWAVMRQHPLFAYAMLAPICFLKPALAIPYGHHERYDGSGYPHGRAGAQIPLAARIFAVVDVWDALRSDRPYRAHWPEEQMRAYIQAQAGKLFDPRSLWRSSRCSATRTSARKASNARLQIDPLTGVPNRRRFFDLAEQALRAAQAGGQPVGAAIFDDAGCRRGKVRSASP